MDQNWRRKQKIYTSLKLKQPTLIVTLHQHTFMKRKIKNKDLEEILSNAAHLGTYPMPGDLTLAVIGTRKKLKTAFETYTDACKQIGESRCEKDKEGKPVTVFQKDEQGKDLVDYPKKLKFKDVSTEQAALDELKKLGEQEVEIEVKELDAEIIEGLKNVTPIQMEAIVALVEIIDTK